MTVLSWLEEPGLVDEPLPARGGTGVVSPARLPQLGRVVWAELEDAHGYRKVRPVVVVTPTADISA